jgi:hypothetical protein
MINIVYLCSEFMEFFQVGVPFIRDEMEYVVITVRGQSFMLHQIRKMIGEHRFVWGLVN